ncbi:MAG: PKD domain-containing protein [Bacteroidota bacterium]
MKKIVFYLICILLSVTAFGQIADEDIPDIGIPKSEIKALIQFFELTGGQNWDQAWPNPNTRWGKIGTDGNYEFNFENLRTWHGVVSSDTHIIGLDSYRMALIGSLEKWDLSQLPFLEILVLDYSNSNFAFNDDVSKWQFEKTTRLKLLRLLSRNFSGDIETLGRNISKNSKLEVLDLFGDFDGDITGLNIYNFPLLENLEIESNNGQLTGDFENWKDLENASKLKDVEIINTGMTGDVSMFDISGMTSLERFVIGGNYLTGDLSEWGRMPNRPFILITGNKFTFQDNIFSLFKDGGIGYWPQKKIDEVKTHVIELGDDFTFEAAVDRTVPGCVYTWYKGDQQVSPAGVNSPVYTVRNIELADLGKYHYTVTNTNDPNNFNITIYKPLELVSEDQELTLSKCPFTTKFRHYNSYCGIKFEPSTDLDPSCYITEYQWDFGDGTTSNEETPFHKFPSENSIYQVQLQVKYACSVGDCFTGSLVFTDFVDLTTNPLTDFKNVIVQSKVYENVLSASVNTFSDFRRLAYDEQALAENHDYLNGRKGVWQNEKSFVYRKDLEVSEEVNNQQDGTYSLEQFNWRYSELEAVPNWLNVTTNTQFNPYGFAVENKDILDNYSASLYSYGGQLPVAVGQNMRQQEMAYTGFEELNSSGLELISDVSQKGVGNWVVSDGGQYYQQQWFTVRKGYGNQAIVNANISEFDDIDAIGVFSRVLSANGEVIESYYRRNVEILCKETYISEEGDEYALLVFDEVIEKGTWFGSLYYYKPGKRGTYSNIVTGIAHSGDKSILVNQTKGFVQKNLRLIPEKEYLLSAWISTNNQYLYNPTLPGSPKMELVFFDESGKWIKTITAQPSGNIIEGWQKADKKFTYPERAATVQLKFVKGSTNFYVDDLRLHPAEGNMESYVYDPKTFRLQASLNQNNYATYFYYDPSGNLYLTKVETEKGIRTIQEVVGHQKQIAPGE